MNTHTSRHTINILILAALVVSACSAAQASAPTTVPPPDTPTAMPPTATATATAIPPTATSMPNGTATAAAQATQTAAPVIAMIDAELKKYGLSTSAGYLGWLHEPVAVKVTTYMEDKRLTDYPDFVAADFVLHTDLTWETSTGFAGCGLVLRSESNLDKGRQYRIHFVRLQGLPLWDIEYYNHGKFQRTVSGDILSAGPLDSTQGSTNAITIMAEGNKITVYANGDRLGAFTDDQLAEGRAAFMALQESGETTCTFTNSWLWVLK